MHSAKEKKKEEGCDDGELRLHRVNAVVRDENFVCVKELLASFTMQYVRGIMRVCVLFPFNVCSL